MAYWLTTHYPHKNPEHPWNVYVKDRYRSRAASLLPGDRVAFYELKGAGKGREAIVRISTVMGRYRPNHSRDAGPEEKDQIWRWEVPCQSEEPSGYVRKDRAYEILKWSKTRRPRIPGGLLAIDADTFRRLETEYKEWNAPVKHQADLIKYLGTSTTFMAPAQLARMRKMS